MNVAAPLVQAILLAFALVVILMPPFILLLRRLGFGKRIRVHGPGSHMVKEGTPSMGGVLMIAVVAGSSVLFTSLPVTTSWARRPSRLFLPCWSWACSGRRTTT